MSKRARQVQCGSALALAGMLGCGLLVGCGLLGGGRGESAAPARGALERMPASSYADKIRGGWYGQCIGNIYGLPHEHAYQEKPRTEPIPGYPESMIGRMRAAGGCFADDDTDVEYAYLTAMERFGVEPTHEQLGGIWVRHINSMIWVANESARYLMAAGYLPPDSGSRQRNQHWSMIDPQLVNEIWAMTAPQMLGYAAAQADWVASVTNDEWGTHATIWYNTMYAAAFTEDDPETLYRIGLAALPADSPMRQCLEDILVWRQQYGDDWLAVRAEVDRKWYVPPHNSMVGSLINGAMGGIALLYGEGDFRKTLNLACMAGRDADNQAATVCGLLGVARGTAAIPEDLLKPLPEWSVPFNNFYNNLTRDDLPSVTMENLIARIIAQGERRIVAGGGRVTVEDGERVYYINRQAVFTPPLELRLAPVALEVGRLGRVEAWAVGTNGPVTWEPAVAMPAGVVWLDGAIVGTPVASGIYPVTLWARDAAGREAGITLPVRVEPANLARTASAVLAQVAADNLEVLRDGNPETLFSWGGQPTTATVAEDWYGYEWAAPVTVTQATLITGHLPWFNTSRFGSIRLQVRDAAGQWVDAPGQVPVKGESEDFRTGPQGSYRRHAIACQPVQTTAVRIVGPLVGTQNQNSIAELMIH